jgi:aspartate/methionine/tyrosine aminotransferase
MDPVHPLATELNDALSSGNPTALSMLSTRGKAAYFPKHGILSQAAEADGARYNATIGIALDDDLSPMRLAAIAEGTTVPPVEAFPYASAFGNATLRAAWRARMIANNPTLKATDATMPVTTAGMTHALSIAASLFLEPGATLLLPAPYWDNYEQIFSEGAGAVLSPFPLFEEKNGRTGFATGALRTALAAGDAPIALLLNFPNNPTGYSASTPEVSEIVSSIQEAAERGRKVTVFVDDAYFGLTYGDAHAESLFAPLASLHENVLAVKIDGPTKEDFAWGLRVGFVTFGTKNLAHESAKALEAKAAGIVRGSVSSGSNLSQHLVLRSLLDPRTDAEKAEKLRLLRERFAEATRLADGEQHQGLFRPLPCNSGYFLCLAPRDGIDAEAVRQMLLAEYSTGVVATNGLLRIAFSSVPKEDLKHLFAHVAEACSRVWSRTMVTSVDMSKSATHAVL